jgi:hypothetical protein
MGGMVSAIMPKTALGPTTPPIHVSRGSPWGIEQKADQYVNLVLSCGMHQTFNFTLWYVFVTGCLVKENNLHIFNIKQ